MNAFGVVHKGYGVGAYYKRNLIEPVTRSVRLRGTLKPLASKKKAPVGSKHKKPLQLGF